MSPACLATEKQLWSLKMAQRIYVVGGPAGIHLVNAISKKAAITKVIGNKYNATIAKPAELIELLGKGVVIEDGSKPVKEE
jgi:hypothetical protein